MIITRLLSWVNKPSARGPVAQVSVNYTADNDARIELKGGILDKRVVPQVVTVDNTQNPQNSTITINGVAIQVAANVRATLPVPNGTQFVQLNATGGTATLIFYADAHDAPPDQPNYLALITAAVAATLVPGLMLPFAGAVAPTGWLICDGSAVSRATFAALFAAIGVTYGAGDGVTSFNVPDLRDRFVLGVSPGGLGGTRATARALASTGGEETHVLTVPELPSHNHGNTGGNSVDHTHGAGAGSSAFQGTTPGGDGAMLGLVGGGDAFAAFGNTAGASAGHVHATNNAGGGGAFDKMPNYLAANWIIRT